MGACSSKSIHDTKTQFHKQQFNFLNICGTGSFAKVWKVQCKKTQKIYALKVMSKAKILSKKSIDPILNQRKLLSKINNDFIVNLIGSFQDRQNLYMLMDFMSGGDLRYQMKSKIKFQENEIKFIIICIIHGLSYLHNMNIIHNDIKPENILFQENGYCKIIDLGISDEWKMGNYRDSNGTRQYMAPQVLFKRNHSFCADYYGVGVIAYQLLTKTRPYSGKTKIQIRDKMVATEIKLQPNYGGVSSQCIDFINKMIEKKPRCRLGYNGINQILEHPWLSLRTSQRNEFLRKKLKAPFIPYQNKQNYYCYKNQEIQQYNQKEKQNLLLLHKNSVQQLFIQYDFVRKQETKAQAKSTLKSKCSKLDASLTTNDATYSHLIGF